MTKVTIEFDIIEEDFEDIQFGMATAYWCENFFRRNDGKLHGFEFRVRETDDNDNDYIRTYEITLEEMREAFAQIVSNRDSNGVKLDIPQYIQAYFVEALWDGEDGRIDCGHIDTEAADVWAQVAIWGCTIFA